MGLECLYSSIKIITWSSHAYPGDGDHGDPSPGSCDTLSNLVPLRSLQHDPVLQLQPPHHRDVDTVGGGHGTEGDQSANQRGEVLGEAVEAEARREGGGGGGAVAGAEGGQGDGGVARPVGVVHHRIEALVDPLPEHDGGGGLVEGHHAPRDGHVEGHLG